jgi:hypothetical protein
VATCSRCGGHLTDDHVCRGRFAVTIEICLDILLASVLGSAAGILVLGVLAEHLTGQSYWPIGLMAGPFVVFAVIRTLRRV